MSWYGMCRCGHHIDGHRLVAGIPQECQKELCLCHVYVARVGYGDEETMSETIGWFDEDSRVWCKGHKPAEGTYVGRLTPILRTDTWLETIGMCSVEECYTLLVDLADNA